MARLVQTNLWVNEGSDPPFASCIFQKVGVLKSVAIADFEELIDNVLV
ncbi:MULTISPECIES: hypothetical protein [Fischerella]|nr:MULTISPECIES: hypothetical protein [Fischerella]MBD2432100.1 hypothetical protein [Fischerella sp. FACHB-380]